MKNFSLTAVRSLAGCAVLAALASALPAAAGADPAETRAQPADQDPAVQAWYVAGGWNRFGANWLLSLGFGAGLTGGGYDFWSGASVPPDLTIRNAALRSEPDAALTEEEKKPTEASLSLLDAALARPAGWAVQLQPASQEPVFSAAPAFTVQPQAAGQLLVVQSNGNPISGSSVVYYTSYTVPAAGDTYQNVDDGYSGPGTITHTQGTLTVLDTISLGTASQGNGVYNLSGTGVLNTKNLYVGFDDQGTFTQTGGSVIVSDELDIGANSKALCTYAISGATSTIMTFTEHVGDIGPGVFNQNGGTNTVTGSVLIGNGSTGTFNLNGGTLRTVSVTTGTLTGSAGTFNLNGGTLQATATANTLISGVTTANVQAGGALIDSNGFAATIPQALLHDPTLGATADGGLWKIGTLTLTLTGTNTFTGPTRVDAGTLALSGATAAALASTASVTVNNGGTLLLGKANQINDAAGMTLNAASGPGAGATRAFNTGGFSETVGALTLQSTSVIDLGAGASILKFANSSAQTWTGTLAIWNWSGTRPAGGGTDRLFFGTTVAGLTAAQLAQITFYSDNGTTNLGTGVFATSLNGEVVANGVVVPEPATWLGGALVLGAVGTCAWRRRRTLAV